jgi:hypothetical protein
LLHAAADAWDGTDAAPVPEKSGSLRSDAEARAEALSHKRKRLTVYLPVALLERLRNAVYWTRETTLAGMLESALAESLDRRERQHGGAFPHRLRELKGGRPKRRRMEAAQE